MILDEIKEYTLKRVEENKKNIPLDVVKQKALSLPKGDFAFEKALKEEKLSFICEVKKASPSKGIIKEDFNYLEIAKQYDAYGATAISVLTEPNFFKGSDEYLTKIKKEVSIPVLRKDFTVDEYMIYEAKVIGADCILLICSILIENQLREYLKIADTLGLSAIVEAHDESEIQMAISAGARIIGVNNRNLKTFEVDIKNSINLRKLVPNDVLFIAESGIKTRQDIIELEQNNVNAVLIGESLMISDNIKASLKNLKGE